MKRFIILLALSFSAVYAVAQEQPIEVRRLEVEPSIGIGSGISLSLEIRTNLSPNWDIGPRASMDFDGAQAGVVSDYNFIRPNKNILFFVGGGIGLGEVDLSDRSMGGSASTTQFYFMPRAGVELFQHLRLTIYANTYNFSHISPFLSLGVAIGGGRKK